MDMDDFVYNKLLEWGLEHWMERFQEEEVDRDKLYCLEEHEIDHLIAKAGPRAKFKIQLKALKSQPRCENVKWNQEMFEEAASVEVSPYTRTICDNDESDKILKDVKSIMTSVEAKLSENTELNRFLRDEIGNLRIDKREMVGVFGQTGAGKSSLINAVVGVRDLLPTASLTACTTAIIKVEANAQGKMYEAEIEFITEMEWKDELWSIKNIFGDIKNYETDEEEYEDIMEKLTAFYGDVWKNKSFENLMEPKYFKEIPEFLQSKKKIIRCEQAKKLMDKVARYIVNGSDEGSSKDVKRWYWPLVKCVTVRVPNNDLLKHVTLVDLPGNGDRYKSRDQLWKNTIGSCSTVWIVTSMNRAAADKYAQQILNSTCDLTGSSGCCQNIHFICTKTDQIDERPDTEVRNTILENNTNAKKHFEDEFKKLAKSKNLREDIFEVSTVSSKEFLKTKYLQPNETEIPKLRESLQRLNELHGQTLLFVFGARRILSMMKEARCGNVCLQQIKLCTKLDDSIKCQLVSVRKSMQDAYMILEKCLTKGVENSRHHCQRSLREQIHCESGSTFHTTLKCVVENRGTHRSKNGETINLNSTLSSFLAKSIKEDFTKVFPIDGKSGHFYGAIHTFSLGASLLMQKYRAQELQLTYLRREEKKIKTQLIKLIRNRKKIIYSSLMQTVEETMQECYKKAAAFSGKGSLANMRCTIETYVQDVKNTLFDQAKAAMLNQLKELMEDLLKVLHGSFQEAIEQSLKVANNLIPDITTEFEEVMLHYNTLMSVDGEDDLLLSDSEK